MPYSSVADLPQRVKDHIPPHAQKIFLHVWNSVYEQTGDETRAFKSAWSKVHRNYGNPGNKNWRKRKPFKYETAKSIKEVDTLWTTLHKRKNVAPDMRGRVTVRPTEFEFDLPFWDKRLRNVIQAIPGADLAGDTTWKVPISGESAAAVAKLLHDADIYMVDWVELERDPAVQKPNAPGGWGRVPAKEHGLNSPMARKGRGTPGEIEAAKSEKDNNIMTDITKSRQHRMVTKPKEGDLFDLSGRQHVVSSVHEVHHEPYLTFHSVGNGAKRKGRMTLGQWRVGHKGGNLRAIANVMSTRTFKSNTDTTEGKTPLEKGIKDNEGAYFSEYAPNSSTIVRQHRVAKVKNIHNGKVSYEHQSRYLRSHDEGGARTGLGTSGGKAGTMSDWDTSMTGFKDRKSAVDDMAHHVLVKQHMANTYPGSNSVKIHHAGLKSAVSRARKNLPYRQEELPNLNTKSQGVGNLAKAISYPIAPPPGMSIFSANGPGNTKPCSQCGGTGFIYVLGVDDVPLTDPDADDANATPVNTMENEAIVEAEQANHFVVDPTQANPLVLSENTTIPVGRSCNFCKRTAQEAATFTLLPDAGYCDDCLGSSAAQR
jgi:cation transport regulator